MSLSPFNLLEFLKAESNISDTGWWVIRGGSNMRVTDRLCGEEGLNGLCHFFAQETTHARTRARARTHTHTHTHIYIYIYIYIYVCLYLGSTLEFVQKTPRFGELGAKVLQKN